MRWEQFRRVLVKRVLKEHAIEQASHPVCLWHGTFRQHQVDHNLNAPWR
jgi:hypothetical protein